MKIKNILAFVLSFLVLVSFIPAEAQGLFVIDVNFKRSFVNDLDTVEVTSTASGGRAPYTYAFYVTREGTKGNVHATTYSSNNKLVYMPNKPGVYHITAHAKDSSGRYTVATLEPMYVNSLEFNIFAEIDNKKLNVGDTLHVKSHPIGGSGTMSYAYYVYKNGERIYYRKYNRKSTLNYRIKSPGVYYVTSFVKDNSGTIKSTTSEAMAIGVEPLTLNLSITSKNHAVGSPIKAKANAAGKGSPMQYSFYVYLDGENVFKGNYGYDPNFSFIPTKNGDYKIVAYAKDSYGSKVTKKSDAIKVGAAEGQKASQSTVVSLNEIEDTPAPAAFSFVPTFDFGEKSVGGIANISVEAFGGKPPYKYACAILRDGKKVVTEQYVDSPMFQYSYSKPGKYVFEVFIKDSAGEILEQSSREVEVNQG
ncbi:MAG: hypothetical protein GYA87_02135 [Christensenellaceae bacterium]|nr:hypothetical protein [Christensenellaceae bacterium]